MDASGTSAGVTCDGWMAFDIVDIIYPHGVYFLHE